MPPRTRRIVAQQPVVEQEEEEGEASSSKNSSLRSFFPLEVVNLILRELNDPPSLAVVCLISFGCLEEASGELYRDVIIRTAKGLISFTCGVKLPPGSRLAPYLSLAQVRNLSFHPLSRNPTADFTPHLVEKRGQRGVSLPPRLLTPISLNRLSVATVFSTTHPEHADRSANFELLLVYVFPYLRPTHVEITAEHFPATTPGGAAYAYSIQAFDWLTTLRAWKNTVRSMGIKTFMPIRNLGGRCFLRDSPFVRDGGSFELTLDVSPWPSSELQKVREVIDVAGMETAGMSGLKMKIVVRKDAQKGLEKEMVRALKEEERERIELVGV